MIRSVVAGFLFLAACGSFACGGYTNTLVESPGRVDERVATSTLRAIGSAQSAYSLATSGAYGSFEQLVAGGYLDSRFSSNQPKVGGYILTMTVANSSAGAGSSYHCNADPDPAVNAAGRHFYIGSASPEIRVNPTTPATVNDEAFQP